MSFGENNLALLVAPLLGMTSMVSPFSNDYFAG